MNSMMLASRLMAKLHVQNLSALVAEDAATLLDAMNGGIREWFEALPPTGRQTMVSELVRAPLRLSISLLHGAREFAYVTPPFPVGGYANEQELLGKSVTVEGSTQLNRLDHASTLLLPHLGPSGDVTATFWGDAIGFTASGLRLASAPIWEGEACGRWMLLPLQDCIFPHRERALLSGPPTHYETVSFHPTTGQSPMWMLRLWPLPSAAGTVSFTMESLPPVLNPDALQIAMDIPVPEQDIPDLLPLCEERLSSTPLWSSRADKQKTWADAARTRERLAARWLPLDARPSFIQTPTHW